MTIFNSEPAKEASTPAVNVTTNIASTAFEKKMNEQMSKGNVLFDSVLSNSNATESNALPISESSIQKSPSTRINNA